MTEKEKADQYWRDHCAEYIFVRKGMSRDEYYEELVYYYRHREEVDKGTYKPLWKQRQEKEGSNL